METIFDYSALDNKGNTVNFADYRGKVIIVVNTASKCGFTPQYSDLQALYTKYKDSGLEIFGFPCDQFLHQEPGNDNEISQFCTLNYGVNFKIMKKIDVNGANAHPVFVYLKKAALGFMGGKIKWNFTKFLISKDGKVVKRYAPITNPQKMESEIVKMLK